MDNKLTPGGNMRWESMRMMLPEHIKAFKQLKIDEQKIPRPEICEDDIIEIEKNLKEAIRDGHMVNMEYFKNGFIKHRICQPAQLDSINKQLIFRDIYGLTLRIDFKDITAVKMSVI